jgi:hypothetical protein
MRAGASESIKQSPSVQYYIQKVGERDQNIHSMEERKRRMVGSLIDGPFSSMVVRQSILVRFATIVGLIGICWCAGGSSFDTRRVADASSSRRRRLKEHRQQWRQAQHHPPSSLGSSSSLTRQQFHHRPALSASTRLHNETSSSPPPLAYCSFRTTSRGRMSRNKAQDLLGQDDFLPPRRYRDRVGMGRVAQGIASHHDDDNDTAVRSRVFTADDPRLTKTYAEFPLSSFDTLLDAGLKEIKKDVSSGMGDVLTMVDLGSGLGRIVLYAALTRGGRGENFLDDGYTLGDELESSQPSLVDNQSWNIHGIEIASLLHDGALKLARKGVEYGIFVEEENHLATNDGVDDTNNSVASGRSGFSFHLGPAENFAFSNLANADIVFAYSTAFSAKEFSPTVGALILDREWSQLLGESCRAGCVAITTDRALDPAFGWIVKDRIDVENRDVLGSTGYIHVLEKTGKVNPP